MNALTLRSKSHRRALGAVLGLAILGAGVGLAATPAKADTWYYDGAGNRVIIRERPVYAPPAYYYAPGPYYYGRDYYYAYPPPAVGIGIGGPGFGIRLGF